MTTKAAEPAVTHPMTSYLDVTPICPLSPLESVVRSNYMDFRYIIPLYGNRDREVASETDEDGGGGDGYFSRLENREHNGRDGIATSRTKHRYTMSIKGKVVYGDR